MESDSDNQVKAFYGKHLSHGSWVFKTALKFWNRGVLPRAENLNLFFKYCLNTVREKKLKKTGIAEYVQVESPPEEAQELF